ncbi:hypothetical protein ZIOFF_054575 [Zingiber officinale]|uniref:Cell division control protein 73 C-terminal domain-containing protein n=1 Tax=Zingiber officinale TaxID=94328 RepID=A0A8J5KR91_ZINOF|nr:hypothetical protein ZIOFF_054575 [Zingiber officinale]
MHENSKGRKVLAAVRQRENPKGWKTLRGGNLSAANETTLNCCPPKAVKDRGPSMTPPEVFTMVVTFSYISLIIDENISSTALLFLHPLSNPTYDSYLLYLTSATRSFTKREEVVPSHPSAKEPPSSAPAVDAYAADQPATVAVDYVAMIRSLERPLKDREAFLECRNHDFHAVLLASTKREEERQRLESQQRKDGLVAKTRLIGTDDHHRPMHLKGSKIGEGVPIILVPSAYSTLITIHNVKEFLEDGIFVPTDAKVKALQGPKPDCVTVQKKLSRDRAVAAYEVRDKPSGFKPEDWDRVVAVFVLGKEWQFKDWPFKDHVEIFNKIIGFYVRFEDDSVESAKTVKQWNVKIISISKHKRHQDRAAALEVWDRLEDSWIRCRRRLTGALSSLPVIVEWQGQWPLRLRILDAVDFAISVTDDISL